MAGFRAEVAFPALSFARPVFLCAPPEGPDELWVVEQAGRIYRFPRREDAGEKELVLDLSAQVSRRGNEEGLLGFAFAPAGRAVYLYYSPLKGEGWIGGRSRLSRFQRSEAGAVDPASEEVLLEVEQPYPNHNGGMLCFGPEGYLYLGLGDGGFAGDPEGHGQRRSTLLGSILRLDVSRPGAGGLAYAIPPDNPFVGDAGARPEVWAYGLRNPWRFSFDPAGALWVGDVGQNAWEEVDRVPRGANCGWRRLEGFALYDEAERAPGAIPPLAAYGRSEGASITGGYVYRGPAHPVLRGSYLYADYVRGSVWALVSDPEAPGVTEGTHLCAPGFRVVKLIAGGESIASFGEDAQGELYLCCFDGKLRRLVQDASPARPGAASPGPTRSPSPAAGGAR